MHLPLAWLVPLMLVAPAIAAEPPPSCLNAPSQACLLSWAWQVSITAPSNDATTPASQDSRQLSEPIMTELLALDPGRDVFDLVVALPDPTQRRYWLSRIASPATLALPEYRQSIRTALTEATAQSASTDQEFVSWSALLGVAYKLDMDVEVKAAFQRVVSRDLPTIQQSETKARAAIMSALIIDDLDAIHGLIGVTTDPASLQRHANLKAWWQAAPSIAGLEEYRQAVRNGLEIATDRLLSHRQSSNWPQFVELANDVGLAEQSVAAFQKGMDFLRSDIASDMRQRDQRIQSAVGVALALKNYAATGELLDLLDPSPDWRDRERTLRAWWETYPAIAEVQQFRQAVATGLGAATEQLSRGSTWEYGTWIGLLRLASDVGLKDLTGQSLRTAVSVIRSGAVPKGEDEDIRLGIVVRAAAMLGEYSTAGELVDRMTVGVRMLEATAWIAYAERHPGRDPGLQDLNDTGSALDILLARREFAVAMEIAASPADYANIALPAAMAADRATASTALARFERLAALTQPDPDTESLSCELKAGFAHLLLDGQFDAASLVERARAWLKAESARLEMGGMLYWWDILALEIVAGDGGRAIEAALTEADLASASEAGKALAIGGASAVAYGIAGKRVLPFMQQAMRLVADVRSPYEKSSTLEMMARLLGNHGTSTRCQ